jgi:Na+/proline symporter
MTNEAPPFIGGWTLITIIAASMSTSDGAILALSTVISHNIFRKFPIGVNEKNLLLVARISALPITIIACVLAAFYQSDNPSGATGYLLIVAFDIVLAGCIVPLFAAFYVKEPSPLAALVAVLGGSVLRLILEFSLPKDGFLILPYPGDEFLDYGVPSSDLYPRFFDVPDNLKWDPSTCGSRRLEDYTGVDSLAAPLFSFILFALVHLVEKRRGKPLIDHKWLQPVPAAEPTEEAEPSKDALKA